jgi:hypothetical protein
MSIGWVVCGTGVSRQGESMVGVVSIGAESCVLDGVFPVPIVSQGEWAMCQYPWAPAEWKVEAAKQWGLSWDESPGESAFGESQEKP